MTAFDAEVTRIQQVIDNLVKENKQLQAALTEAEVQVNKLFRSLRDAEVSDLIRMQHKLRASYASI